MNESVILKRAASYDDPALYSAVDEILASTGFSAFSPQQTVVLKLNLLMRATPDEAVTTHPAVVSALIAALKKRGAANIVLCDSPSGVLSDARLHGIYDDAGITALCGEGVSLALSYGSTVRKGLGRINDFEIIDPLCSADVIIGVGKLKTHMMTGMTGAVKNFFGAVPGLKKAQLHCCFPQKAAFCDMLCELYDLVDPDLNIVDAVVGMEGDGPSGGTPRTFGFVAGSKNAYALDRVLCEIIGMGPERALTVRASIASGRAPKELSAITIEGDRSLVDSPITDLKVPHNRDVDFSGWFPAPLRSFASGWIKRMSPRPVIRARDCVGCGRCAEICPARTIKIENKKACIDRANCIHCFCCHEVCPSRAIDIKSNPLFRILK